MFGKCVRIAALPAALSLYSVVLLAAPRTFVPDVTFTGSSLSGWHSVGQANWKAQDGEIVGMPKSVDGGWLVLDKSFEDIGEVLTHASQA